jgi:hypothetical protein
MRGGLWCGAPRRHASPHPGPEYGGATSQGLAGPEGGFSPRQIRSHLLASLPVELECAVHVALLLTRHQHAAIGDASGRQPLGPHVAQQAGDQAQRRGRGQVGARIHEAGVGPDIGGNAGRLRRAMQGGRARWGQGITAHHSPARQIKAKNKAHLHGFENARGRLHIPRLGMHIQQRPKRALGRSAACGAGHARQVSVPATAEHPGPASPPGTARVRS